ncbi:MAG: hypothetical protein ABJH08_01330 [Balneola sp.]
MRLLFLLTIFLLFSCSTWKESLVEKGDKEEAIQNAILDFSHTKRLFKQDSVFYIGVDDPLVIFKEGKTRWHPHKTHDKIIGISIVGDSENLYHKSDVELNKPNENPRIPSRFVIHNEKLFLWYDDTQQITQELVDAISQFGLVRDNDEELFVVIDDGKKGANYFFCRNDLSRYKKVINNIAIGYYDMPKLSCP